MAKAIEKEEVPDNPYLELPIEKLGAHYKQQRELTAEYSKALDVQKSILRNIEEALIDYSFKNPSLTGFKITGVGTLSFSDETVYNVTNWDSLYAYIKENNAFHLLARRLNNAPVRETIGLGEELPVEPFTRRKVGLRKS